MQDWEEHACCFNQVSVPVLVIRFKSDWKWGRGTQSRVNGERAELFEHYSQSPHNRYRTRTETGLKVVSAPQWLVWEKEVGGAERERVSLFG